LVGNFCHVGICLVYVEVVGENSVFGVGEFPAA
jgi:hypothetical protein